MGALLCVLRRIVELINARSPVGVSLYPSCVPIVGHDLGSHIGAHFFPLLVHVLKILGGSPLKDSRTYCSLPNGSAWDGSFLLFLQLSQLRSVALLLKNPVELAISRPARLRHKSSPEALEIVVIRALFEIQILAVIQILVELLWRPTTQLLYGSLNLLLLDSVVLVVLVFSSEALPRQRAFQEVEQDVAKGLYIVSPSLLDSNVRVHTSVASRSSQRLVISVRDVIACLGVFVALGEAEVDHETCVPLVIVSHQEVIRLHVTMQEVVRVQVLETGEHLISQHANSFQSESTSTILEQIFE
jgi:hypothetical protein